MNSEQLKSWYKNNVWFNKIKIPLFICTGLLLFYTVFGFLILPWIIKAKLPDIVHEQTGKSAVVNEVKFNPYQLALSMQGFTMSEPDGKKIVSLEELFVDVGLWASIRHFAVAFDRISLLQPYTHIIISPEGAINLAELGKSDKVEEPEEEPSDALFPLFFNNIKLVQGEVEFSDQTLDDPFHTVITPIDFEIEKFATIKLDDATDDKLSMVFADGGMFTWDGDIIMFPVIKSHGQFMLKDFYSETVRNYIEQYANLEVKKGKVNLLTDYNFQLSADETSLEFSNSQVTLSDFIGAEGTLQWNGNFVALPVMQSAGKVAATGVKVKKLWQFLDQQAMTKKLEFSIRNGEMNAWTDYEFEMLDNKQAHMVSSQGKVELKDFALSARDSDKQVISVSDLAVQGMKFDVQKQQLNIDTINSDTANIYTHISKEGKVNLTELFTEKVVKIAEEFRKQTEELRPRGNVFQFNLTSLDLQNYTVDVKQETEGKPVELKLTPISVSVKNFSTKPGSEFTVNTDITVNQSGKINAQGKASIDPVQANLNIKASELALMPFQPFLDQATKLKLTAGTVYSDTNVTLALNKDKGKLDLKATGNAGVKNLKTVEAGNNKEFLKWRAVNVKNYKFSLDPMQLDIAAVNVKGIDTKVIVNEDRSTNVGYLFSKPKGKTTAKKKNQSKTKKAKTATKTFKLNIGAINVADSAAFYADRSLILPFAADIKKLHGAIKKVSTNKNTRTLINLEGKVNHTAPAVIKGSVEAFDFQNHMDIQMHFQGIDMTSMTPYMAEFAGYKVEKGKLSVDLHYKIENKQLNATNQVVLDQLTLGEKVDSPNSVSVPVGLAIGLLKDRNGVIDLNLPIEGSLDDPKFSVFGLVGKVLLNVITKAVAAPFTMIGGLFNTDADLSKVGFTAGSAELGAEQKQNLDTLAAGLNERPQLQLEVRGVAYQDADGKKLAEQDLTHQLKAAAWDDMYKFQRPDSIEKVELSEEDYYEFLSEIYKEKFPERAKEVINKAEDAPDPAAAKDVYEQMKTELVAAQTVDEHLLNQLANQRAENIMDYLTEHSQIGSERVFILDRSILPVAENNEVTIELKLGAK